MSFSSIGPVIFHSESPDSAWRDSPLNRQEEPQDQITSANTPFSSPPETSNSPHFNEDVKQTRVEPDGSIFEGFMIGQKKHGLGEIKYANGDRYYGDFRDNQRSGYGELDMVGKGHSL